MNKKKAIICTILFIIVVSSALIGSTFIGNDDGDTLFNLIISIAAGLWFGELVEKFYKWISK